MNYPGIQIFLKLIFFIISSWLLVHVMGLLGVFLVIAYPIWWAFAPQYVPCIYCQTRHEGNWCPLCKRKISKSNGISPETITSVILNAIIILIMTLFSLGFILVESKLVSFFGIIPKEKTVSFIIPDRGEYSVGETFPMEIKISGIKEAINSIQADIKFDPAVLEVVEISTENSFANIFVQKEINNELGYLRLSGGLPNPGYDKQQGLFGTVYFKGKTPSVVSVNFLPSSMVLANDGKGSKLLKEFASASYLIKPASPDEIFPNKKMTILSQVLGENAETKLIIEANPHVLGLKASSSSAELSNTQAENPNILVKTLVLVDKIDKAILNTWAKFSPLL